MGITYGYHLIDSGYYDITPEHEREIEAREECVSDDPIERALKVRVDLIQGFTYPDRHVIRDFRANAAGTELWSSPKTEDYETGHNELMHKLEYLKLAAQIEEASKVPPAHQGRKPDLSIDDRVHLDVTGHLPEDF